MTTLSLSFLFAYHASPLSGQSGKPFFAGVYLLKVLNQNKKANTVEGRGRKSLEALNDSD